MEPGQEMYSIDSLWRFQVLRFLLALLMITVFCYSKVSIAEESDSVDDKLEQTDQEKKIVEETDNKKKVRKKRRRSRRYGPRRRGRREKQIQGTKAAKGFRKDAVIKSRYTYKGRQLDVDPD